MDHWRQLIAKRNDAKQHAVGRLKPEALTAAVAVRKLSCLVSIHSRPDGVALGRGHTVPQWWCIVVVMAGGGDD